MKALTRALEFDCKPEIPDSEFWQKAYNTEILAQICKVRNYLFNHDEPSECALRGILLGALHGPKAKNINNTSYMGNQMPRTYAPKPAYSLRYWNTQNLFPDSINIQEIVKKRAIRYYKSNIPIVQNKIIYGDSREAGNFQKIPIVSVIITSPPYYGMQTYYTDQWLRNWFLGGPDCPVHAYNKQLRHSSPKEFSIELSRVWKNCAAISQKKARMYVRYGGISSRKANTREIFEDSITLTNGTWKILTIRDAGNSTQGNRQAVQMLSTTHTQNPPINEFDVELILNA
jgi:hypothetical protein